MLKSVLIILLCVITAVGFLFLPVRQWLEALEIYIHSLGALGPVIFAIAYVATTVLFVPGSFMTIAGGGLFGLSIGFSVVFIAANVGALCAFLLARTYLRDKVAQWARAKPKFRSLDQAIGQHGFKMVFLTRLSPVFPFVLLNYLLGLTAVRTGAYVLANLLGMLPGTFLFVYIGAAARDALAGKATSADFYQQILKYVGLAATFAVVVLVTRVARKALREAEQSNSDGVVTAKPPLEVDHKPTPFSDMLLVDDVHDRRLVENCHPPKWINPTPAGKYNLVVVGAGTAGLVSAAGAAGLGAKVAVIERNLFGGDCLNSGCVPSKAIIRAARAAYEARNSAQFGVYFVCRPEVAFSTAMERMRKLRAGLSGHDSAERFRSLGVDVYIGDGRFTRSNEVDVEGKRLSFDRAVIATGARAAELPIPVLRRPAI